jgi:hypothetical protein
MASGAIAWKNSAFPALSLGELHQLAEQNRNNETVTRLLREIRALHVVVYNAWRLEAEHYFVYLDNPQGAANAVQLSLNGIFHWREAKRL